MMPTGETGYWLNILRKKDGCLPHPAWRMLEVAQLPAITGTKAFGS